VNAIVQTLVRGGAAMNAVNDAGETALHAAARWGLSVAASHLLKGGAALAVERKGDGATPADLAARGRHGDVAWLLANWHTVQAQRALNDVAAEIAGLAAKAASRREPPGLRAARTRSTPPAAGGGGAGSLPAEQLLSRWGVLESWMDSQRAQQEADRTRAPLRDRVAPAIAEAAYDPVAGKLRLVRDHHVGPTAAQAGTSGLTQLLRDLTVGTSSGSASGWLTMGERGRALVTRRLAADAAADQLTPRQGGDDAVGGRDSDGDDVSIAALADGGRADDPFTDTAARKARRIVGGGAGRNSEAAGPRRPPATDLTERWHPSLYHQLAIHATVAAQASGGDRGDGSRPPSRMRLVSPPRTATTPQRWQQRPAIAASIPLTLGPVPAAHDGAIAPLPSASGGWDGGYGSPASPHASAPLGRPRLRDGSSRTAASPPVGTLAMRGDPPRRAADSAALVPFRGSGNDDVTQQPSTARSDSDDPAVGLMRASADMDGIVRAVRIKERRITAAKWQRADAAAAAAADGDVSEVAHMVLSIVDGGPIRRRPPTPAEGAARRQVPSDGEPQPGGASLARRRAMAAALAADTPGERYGAVHTHVVDDSVHTRRPALLSPTWHASRWRLDNRAAAAAAAAAAGKDGRVTAAQVGTNQRALRRLLVGEEGGTGGVGGGAGLPADEVPGVDADLAHMFVV
jgi:hypothetical protein